MSTNDLVVSTEKHDLSGQSLRKRRRSGNFTMAPHNGSRTLFNSAGGFPQSEADFVEADHSAAQAKLADENVAPFLARHIPSQYAPLGEQSNTTMTLPPSLNSRYCYRHRPDLKCRRQVDEPSMDQLQRVGFPLEQM